MTDPGDPRLRFRFWIDAKLVDEAWVDSSNPDSLEHADAIRDRHGELVEQANLDGLPWLVEMYDPAKPKDEAYTRIGTDLGGIIDPRLP